MEDQGEMIIGHADNFDRLNDIPAAVTKVTIRRIPRIIELPRLPAHVTTLILSEVNLRGPVVFSEGLQSLTLSTLTFEVPLLHWQFPSTLQQISVTRWTGDLDLRSATASSINCRDPSNRGLIRLPEALDKLRVLSTGEIEFPPYLRELWLAESISQLTKTLPSVRTLIINRRSSVVDIERQFPNLEFLEYMNFSDQTLGDIEMDSLRELYMIYPIDDMTGQSNRPRMVLPQLEKLTLASSGGRMQIFFDHPDNTLGDTVKTLVLTNVPAFPKIAQEWERLESLTVNTFNSNFELPFIRWLNELNLVRPLLANGVMVETIEEYKVAWNLKKRAKRAK